MPTPESTFIFYDCENKAGVRGSACLMLFKNSYACFLYPHGNNDRIPVSLEDLDNYDKPKLFTSLQIHLRYRIFN